jgi:O-antigen ligase
MGLLTLYHNRKSKDRRYLALHAFFALVMLYAIADSRSSANVGIRDADRRLVHLALLALLVYLGAYYLYSLISGRMRRSRTSKVLGLVTMWIAIVNFLQGTETWSMAAQIGLSTLWLVVYSFFSNYLRRFPGAYYCVEVFIKAMFGFYVVCALYSAHTLRMQYNRLVAINLAYGVLVFLPWFSVVSRKWVRCLGVGIVWLVVLVSMKRGAIIALCAMMITWGLVDGLVRKKAGRATMWIIIVMTVFCMGLFCVDNWTGGYLSQRFSPEVLRSGSGRDRIYRDALADISRRPLSAFVIGRGSGSTVETLGTSAHNDWLEFLFSFGTVGLVCYALLYCILVIRTWLLTKRRSRFAPAYAMALIYMILVSMYGQIYFAHSTLYVVALFGAIDGLVFSDILGAQMLSG